MTNPDPKFAFYEKVLIQTIDKNKAEVNGKLAAILGRVETEDGSSWYYSVHVYGHEHSWCMFENELQETGEHACREDFYGGESIRVSVDEHGRGEIVPDTETE